MNNELEYIMLCGVCGAGKSTLLNRITESTDKYTILSPDEKRKEHFGDYIFDQNETQIFKELADLEKEAIKSGKSIIYDGMNISYKNRMNKLKLIRQYNPSVICKIIYLERDLKTLLAQNGSRSGNKRLEDKVVIQNFKYICPPTVQEKWDKIYYEYGDGILHQYHQE